MNIRVKKAIGTVLILLFMLGYILFILGLAARWMPGASGWAEVAFYTFFGLIWVLPVGAIITWMQRPAR